MARKRKIDSRMLIYTIFASLIVITPIILIAYLCISNQFEMCPKYMNGEFISVRCREVTSTLEIINKYKGALLATLIGNAFLMPAILLGYYEHHQEKDSIRNDIIVIALYFISWIIAIYLTWYPLFMFFHHLFGIGAVMDLRVKLKERKKLSSNTYEISETVKKEKEKLTRKK